MRGATTPDYGDFLIRLAIDLVAIGLCAWALYFRRHGRTDLVVTYPTLNVV